jgi:hypothetical protein
VEGHLYLNFSVFLLPVGIGLLRGRARSQWWARVWIFLGYLVCALLAVLALFMPEAANVSLPGIELHGPAALPYLFTTVCLVAFTLHIMHRLLYSPKACEWFGTRGRVASGRVPAAAGFRTR